MARVPLQPPAYVKLDVQSRELRGYASVDSPLFSLELDGGDRTASDDDEDDAKTFLPLSGAARKVSIAGSPFLMQRCTHNSLPLSAARLHCR